MTDPITLERRLVSQGLRDLFTRLKNGTFKPADKERLLALLTALADGDSAAGERAFLRFGNQSPDGIGGSLLSLFLEGRLDVVGIRDDELAWSLTAAEVAAQETANG